MPENKQYENAYKVQAVKLAKKIGHLITGLVNCTLAVLQ